jgi:putative tryptophan/tyrosine transport system substrate-binding protein
VNRRAFVTGLGALLAAPLFADAQQAAKLPRIGYASVNARSVTVEAFEQGLRQLGYVLGQNIVIEYRFAEGRLERVPVLINELLATGVDVLLAANPHALRAAIQATTTVSIVGIDLETDPVRAGWVKTLARPGGNVTGFFLDIPELSAKQVQFLIEAIPRLQRVAVMWDAEVATSQLSAVERVAHSVKIKTESLPFRRTDEFRRAFEMAQRAQAQALIVLSSPVVFAHLRDLADLAHQFGLPAISIFPQFAEAGGLIGYGPNVIDLFRRAARYVDQILKGAKAADLPIQRPVQLDFAVNLKTAKTLGLTIPPSLLLRADQVIE